MIPPIVASQAMTKSFAPAAGVFELDLEITEGQIVGFIGPSGSGKTTTVRLMTGLLAPDEGSILVLGETPTDFSPNTRARIGYMPQQAILYPDLTLDQNLRFTASLYGAGAGTSRRMAGLVDFLELGDAMGRLPVQASGGEQRRLMLASTLAHGPDLMFLDEPTAGIDPVLRRQIWDRLSEVSKAGASLIVTTQYVGEAAYCDYVAVLAKGRLLLFDTPEGLRRNAYGGELIDVVFSAPVSDDDLARLCESVSGLVQRRIDRHTVRLVVDDAGSAAPAIGRWAQEAAIDVEATEAHVPPYDDVFVELVERLDGARERSEGQVGEAVGN